MTGAAIKGRALVGAVGLFLGFSLGRIGFASWDQVHAMFTFSDLRLFLTFVAGVCLLTVAWTIVRRLTHPTWESRRIHRGTVPGGILFGLGWALCGACPAIALVQVGEGQLGGLLTLAGILGGNWIYAALNERYLHWTAPAVAAPHELTAARAGR